MVKERKRWGEKSQGKVGTARPFKMHGEDEI